MEIMGRKEGMVWEQGSDGPVKGGGCGGQDQWFPALLEFPSAGFLTSQPSQAWFVSFQTTARHPCPPDFAQGLSPVELSVTISDL